MEEVNVENYDQCLKFTQLKRIQDRDEIWVEDYNIEAVQYHEFVGLM